MTENKPYWHEKFSSVDECEEWKKSRPAGHTWQNIMDEFSQPDWCEYPDALAGHMGCWSLIYGMVKDKAYCKECELCTS